MVREGHASELGLIASNFVEKQGTGRSSSYKVRTESLATAGRPRRPMDLLVARMKSAGFIRNEDYREAFGVGRPEASRALSALVKAGVIVRSGERKATKYAPGPAWPPPGGQL